VIFRAALDFGWHVFSRIDPKRDRVTNEKTHCEKVLFQFFRLSFVPHWKRLREAVGWTNAVTDAEAAVATDF
jgi:hypothetical protein